MSAKGKDVRINIVGKDLTARAFKSAQSNLSRMDRAALQVANSLGTIGVAAGSVIAVTVGLSRAYYSAAKEATKFQKSVYEINTLLNLSSSEAKTLGFGLRELSTRFGQSSKSMAKAEYDVVSAGFSDIAESANILETASKAAIGGVSDVATAARLITQTLNSYNMSAKDADRVSDIFFTTVKYGVTTFTELADALGKVTATAATTGVPLEEVSAAMAAMTKKGINTNEASIALNSLLVGIGAASPAAKKELDRLGISLKDGLGPALIAIDQAGGGSLDILKQMVPNVRALRAATALGANGAQEFVTQLNHMKGSSGATGRAFGVMAETTDLSVSRLSEAFNRLKGAVGDTLIKEVNPAIDAATESLDGLAAAIENKGDTIIDFYADLNKAMAGQSGAGTASGGGIVAQQILFRQMQADWNRLDKQMSKPVGVLGIGAGYADVAIGFKSIKDELIAAGKAARNFGTDAEQALALAAQAFEDQQIQEAVDFGMIIPIGFQPDPATVAKDFSSAMSSFDAAVGQYALDGLFNATELMEIDRYVNSIGETASESMTILGDAAQLGADRMANAIERAVFESQDLLQGLGNVARSVFSSILSGFITMGVRSILPGGWIGAGVSAATGADSFIGPPAPSGASAAAAMAPVTIGNLNVHATSMVTDDPLSRRRMAEDIYTEIQKVAKHHG